MKLTVKTTGMSCAACSARIDRSLGKIDGIISVNADFSGNVVTVEYDPDKISADKIPEAIRKLGYGTIESGETEDRKESRNLKRDLLISALFTSVLMIYAMGPMLGLDMPFRDRPLVYALIQLALCIPVLIGGRRFYVRGLPSLFKGSPTMDSLVSLGTIAALVYSIWIMISAGSSDSLFFDSAAMIITLVSAGKYLEAGSKVKTGDALRNLGEMAPDKVTVEIGGEYVTIPASEAKPGQIALVKPGERVSADGIAVGGETYIDESMLTGESMPVFKKTGDRVFCGTVNTTGSIRAEITGTGENTALSKIMEMVRDARSTKAPIARVADRVAAVFVPIVIAIASVSGILWFLAGKGIGFALISFISVLVISCPCAMGLATPMAITVGTGRAAEFGILFKDAAALERAGRITDIILDKTGTLTEGKPKITSLSTDMDEKEFIGILASAESLSEHPIGKAVTDMAESMGAAITAPENFESHTGRGISCTVGGRAVRAGNKSFMEESGATVPEYEESEGKSRIHMSIDGIHKGSVLITDPARKESAEAVAMLKAMGIRTSMVTGDSGSAAMAIAAELGITEVVHSALPGDKVMAVKKKQAAGADVAVAGDGINDSPALTQADLGIAVASGTDIAADSADVVLLNDDVRSIPAALSVGRSVLGNVKQNLFFAFCYNAVCIPLAAGLPVVLGAGEFHQMPMLAALAMSLSSVSVVTNALRLRKMSPGYLPGSGKEAKNE